MYIRFQDLISNLFRCRRLHHLLRFCFLRHRIVVGVPSSPVKQQSTECREEDREPGKDRAESHFAKEVSEELTPIVHKQTAHARYHLFLYSGEMPIAFSIS